MKPTEQYEDEFSSTLNMHICNKCNSSFTYKPDDVCWDDHGYGYSTKFIKCPHCGAIHLLKYVDDYGFYKLNTDTRYF